MAWWSGGPTTMESRTYRSRCQPLDHMKRTTHEIEKAQNGPCACRDSVPRSTHQKFHLRKFLNRDMRRRYNFAVDFPPPILLIASA